MRKLVSFAATLCATTMVLLGLPGSATADNYRDPQVAWTGRTINVSPDGSTAYINGKYNCVGGRENTHLWVSVKQGPNVDPEHTGSEDAAAWFDTNWNFGQSEAGLTVNCDGHWHTTRYTLKSEFGELVDGIAFVQFCLFDSSGSEEDPSQGFAFDYSWKMVRVP